ncbi:MAG TPA: peptidoglycan DD-metalloendopeptidase family protein [Kofleriaceae bacterium]|jgi:murein DD-endopeptidase MepM/ murein hydrolase activator NlpD|nr:peptidoglycan DD-metalloendopeptidase family protein [Kofleriaceae bacterium]
MKTLALHPTPVAHNDPKQVAAKQLEAFFLRRMLAEARPEGTGGLDGGFAGDTFKQMLDEAIADKMSAAGGVGMAKMFAKQLGGSEETAKVANPMPASSMPLPSHELGAESLGAPRLQLPVNGTATSGYGMRNDPVHGISQNHPGFDLAAKTGTPVAAAAGGTITHAGEAGTYGNLVTIRHDNGFETRYAHLSAVTVKVGDKVDAGQQVGNVGTTGYSTGPHLHFELRRDGKPLDPAPLLPLHRSPGRTNP